MRSKDFKLLVLSEQILKQLVQLAIYSKVDLVRAYHHLSIRQDSSSITAVVTRLILLDWWVFCFRLTGTSTALLHLVGYISTKQNGYFLISFSDHVVICSKLIDAHRAPVTTPLEP